MKEITLKRQSGEVEDSATTASALEGLCSEGWVSEVCVCVCVCVCVWVCVWCVVCVCVCVLDGPEHSRLPLLPLMIFPLLPMLASLEVFRVPVSVRSMAISLRLRAAWILDYREGRGEKN